jgi:anti-sigma factor RsiW
MSHPEQFTEWLPWYVNGTLNAKDRAAMDAYLAKSSLARDEVQYYERMAATMQRRTENIPADIGLAQTLQRIKVSPKAQGTHTTVPRVKPNAPDTSEPNWFQRLLSGGWMKPALGCAAAVIVAQGVLLVQQRDAAIVYRGKASITDVKTTGAKTEAAYLRVVFKPNATEGELRLLLASSNAWIAGGPGQAGEYYLRFTPDQVQGAMDLLKASGLVSEAAPVNQLPDMQ